MDTTGGTTMTRDDRTLGQRDEQLAQLAAEAEACRACPLGGVRTQAVFSRGSADADVMFVGEAPGFHEDKQGQPFVGAAGQLLDRLVEQHLGLGRDEIMVVNVLKCRPPGNRDPLPEEVEACRHFLEAQIRLVAPALIVPLGNFAAKLLLDTKTGITRLRGRRFPFPGGVVIPTFHPAAALRGGAAAAGIVEDFEEIARALSELSQAPPDDPEVPSEQLGLF